MIPKDKEYSLLICLISFILIILMVIASIFTTGRVIKENNERNMIYEKKQK